MPEAHKRAYRHPKYKTSYRVKNWPEYETSLRNRGRIGIWFLYLPCFTHIFIQFPPFDIPYNLYHRETLWSNTEKSGKEMSLQKI
jgi:hypothetical protein